MRSLAAIVLLALAVIFALAAGHQASVQPVDLQPIGTGVAAGSVEVNGLVFHVVTVPPDRLHLIGQGAERPRTPGALRALLTERGEKLVAATNAGLFHDGFHPVGLHVEQTVERRPVERGDGDGNFFWKPNAVFWIANGEAGVTATPEWTDRPVDLAVQSGPALVLRGELHPGFRPGAPAKLRSGVGVCGDEVALVRSDAKVDFYTFASVFRDTLGCEDALFLDGTISGLWADRLPGTRRGFEYAGFLYVSEPI